MFNNYLFNEGLELNEKSKQNLILSVALFDEAFEKTKNDLKQKNIKWRDFPNLYTRDESFDMRMSAVERGIKERINLLPLIKKFMKINFPDFIYKKTPDGRRVFYKQINDYIKLGIGFETIHHLGLGKAFTLCLNIEHIDEPLLGHIWSENFFRLYGEKDSWPPCYTYSVKDDLNPIFKSVEEIINKTFPIFESTLKHSFDKSPEMIDNYANSNQYEIELCNRVLYIRKVN